MLWPTLFRTYLACLPCSALCPHDFWLASDLSPSALWMLWVLWSAWFRTCLPAVSRYTLDSLPAWFQACLHLSPSPLWMLLSAWFRACLPQLFPTILWVLCPYDFTLVSYLSPSTLCSASHDFTLASHLSTLVSPFSQRHGSFCIVCGTTTTNHQPPTTFNQPLPSTFAGSDLNHDIRLIYKQTVWGQRWL